MDTNDGGDSSTRHESAAELARKKVLAVYSSTLESLQKNSAASSAQSHRHDQYRTPPTPNIVYSDQDDFNTRDTHLNRAGNDYEQINFEPTDPSINNNYDTTAQNETLTQTQTTAEQPQQYSDYHQQSSQAQSSTPQQYQQYQTQPQNTTPAEATPVHQSSDATIGALKDLPINQAAVNTEWQKYHSAWQSYYQNYYNDYYAKAAQNYLATEKLKTERVASGKVRKVRHFRRLMPLFAGLAVVLVILFLQYNRLIFAPIMAYVSPNNTEVATSIEAVNPTITQAVSPEPRLIIPKLNVDVPVAFGISTSEVDSAMNHGVAQFMIPGANAMPGEVGNLVISGHSAGDIYSSNPYKFIFSGLERLTEGDLLYINYESVRYTYQMTRSEVVEPTNVAALIYETTKPMLTLITCTPLGTSRYRLLITAEQINPASEYTEADPITPPAETPDATMPANEPTLFESIFGR